MTTPRTLVLYEDYTRREVHDLLAPEAAFTPQAGTWGLQGIVEFEPREFVFFVTLGRKQGAHTFDEGITTDGVLTWQSQPKQRRSTPQIQRLIEHDEDRQTVHLFLRASEGREVGAPLPYTYLGPLKYLNHDADREEPVYFQWQLLEWPAPEAVWNRIGLHLLIPEPAAAVVPAAATPGELVQQQPPDVSPRREGVSTTTFRARKKPDYAKRDAANRALGLAGELAVVRLEKAGLTAAGREDLASKVRHLPSFEGDGAGYDVASFDPHSGELRFIEVKTTRGEADTEFYMSANELEKARSLGERYFLYRLYNFDERVGAGSFFVLTGIEKNLSLMPTQYRARLIGA